MQGWPTPTARRAGAPGDLDGQPHAATTLTTVVHHRIDEVWS